MLKLIAMAQRKRNIEFSRPDEPSFLKKMKAQIGYQNQDSGSIESKKSALEKAQTSDVTDREDEQPVFVIPEEANITETELNAFKEKLKDDLEPVNQIDTLNQKIVFRKPTKDKSSNQGMQAVQSSSKKTDKTDESSKLLDKRSQIKSVKNSSLLSFNEDDEEN